MRILVTGNAGFIGSHVVRRLIERGDDVVGLDVINDYYDPHLKRARLAHQAEVAGRLGASYQFMQADIADRDAVRTCFKTYRCERVVHLAAQAGVRYSLENPHSYVESNLVGFANILEACRHSDVHHLVYASTSSVYGANTRMPFSEQDPVDHPLQLYAATKRANELMAHSYAHLYGLPATGLRFFTVYGPWGRPDMALFKFTKNILERRPIQVFNNGNHTRDFTYIDDIVEGLIRATDAVAAPDPVWNGNLPDAATSYAPYRIYNIGSGTPVRLSDFIDAIEEALGRRALREFLPMQPGDLPDTFADIDDLASVLGYRPVVSVAEGVRRFVEWYLDYYRIADG